MKKTLIALVVIGLFLITACTPQIPIYKAPPAKEPQPPQTPAPTMSFEEMYFNAECADIKNEFYVIPSNLESGYRSYGGYVFWNREGNCMDNSFEQTLFYSLSFDRVGDILCSRSDSIAGVREYCNNEGQRQVFSTIINNLDKPDFGLDGHAVIKMTFEPTTGVEIPFEEIEIPCVQRITRNQVINTQEEYELLSANIDCLNLPPKIDFTKKTLLGKGMFGCFNDYARWVVRDDEKKAYYYLIKKKEYYYDLIKQKLEQKSGFCEMVDPWTQNWILVPKIPQDYAVRFIARSL